MKKVEIEIDGQYYSLIKKEKITEITYDEYVNAKEICKLYKAQNLKKCDKLNTKIKDYPFSIRVQNILSNYCYYEKLGIEGKSRNVTLNELKKSIIEKGGIKYIFNYRNCGHRSLIEINEALGL